MKAPTFCPALRKGLILFAPVALVALAGCSHKKPATTTLSELQGKKVALFEVIGPEEARDHVEVALVNEISDKGRFEIVDRTTVTEAKVTYPTETDWQRLGQKIGADFVMSMRVREFDADERQGYDKVEEEDSVLTEESGASKPVIGTRYLKVKSVQGKVTLFGKFFDVAAGKMVYEGTGSATETIDSRATEKNKDGANPRKMALLERLSHQAVRDFFEKIPK